jgi:hypothetical protein
MGTDLASVRVNADAPNVAAAPVNAAAFSVANHLVFARNEFAPNTTVDSVVDKARQMSPRTAAGENSSAPRLSSAPVPPMDKPAIPHNIDGARLGRGDPLEPTIRARLEHSFGTELGHVRLHSGPEAAQVAARINARSFTIGSRIGFPRAAYSPHSDAGYHILAHEIAHVIQQQPIAGAHCAATKSDDTFERSAESAADQAIRGGLIRDLPVSRTILIAREGSFRPLDWIESNIDAAKEYGYKNLILATRELHRSGIGRLRAFGSGLPEEDRSTFDAMVEAVDLTLTIFEGLIYAVVSISAGFVTGIIQTVIGLIRLLSSAAEGLLKFLWGFIDGGREYNAWAEGVLKVVRAIPSGLRAYVDDWKARFAKASPEDSAIMIGELTGQILAFLATLGVSAGKAGTFAQASKLEAGLARAAQAVFEPATAVTSTGIVLGAATEASPKLTALASTAIKQGGAAAEATILTAGKVAGGGPSFDERLSNLENRIDALGNEELYDRLRSLVRRKSATPNADDLISLLKSLEKDVSHAEEGPRLGNQLEPGLSDSSSPGGPQPRRFASGNFAHKWLEKLRDKLTTPVHKDFAELERSGKVISLDKMPDGLADEVKLGDTARADRVGAVIYEVKPNTPSNITKGIARVDEYVRLANATRYLGRTDWTGKVVVYDPVAAAKYIP